MSARYDVVIRNGWIVDGTRFPRYRADIGIRDGVIAKIGTIAPADAARVLDAEGLIVAPGFVDLHTHYDAQIHWDPYCSNSGENGVTTVIAGNCGFAFAPCKEADRDRYMLMMENTEQVPYQHMKTMLPWTWETFPQWLAHLRALKKGVNMMMLMPINPLLCYVMGTDAAKSRRPTASEMAEMKRLIHEAMDAGAAGLGVSLLGNDNSHTDYDGSSMPSDVMHRDDIVELASVLGERDEGFIQVLAQLGNHRETDVIERIAQVSRRPVLLNIFVTTDLMPDFHRPHLEWLSAVNARGLRIYGQTFAQRGFSEFNVLEFNINDHIPEWRQISRLHDKAEKKRLIADPAHRARMRASYDPMVLSFGSGPLEVITVSSVGDAPELQKYVNRSLGEIAAEEGKHVIDVLFDISLATDLAADFRTPSPVGTDPHRTAELLLHPQTLAGTSDGGAHMRFFSGGHWPTELLIWLVRETGVISLEEMHYRLSYQPARIAGLGGRGALLEGMAADIVVYDFDALWMKTEKYDLRFDFPGGDWRRYTPTEGYRWILCNGAVTHENGQPTGVTPGSFLGLRPLTGWAA